MCQGRLRAAGDTSTGRALSHQPFLRARQPRCPCSLLWGTVPQFSQPSWVPWKPLGSEGPPLDVMARLSPAGRVHIHTAGPHPSISDSGGLGWNPRVYISSKFPGDADAETL